jgi:GNAT superfamily N-acetyltransferase
MDIQYVSATPELTAQYHEQSGSNATDFVHFDDDYYNMVALADGEPVGLIVAKRRSIPEPLQAITEAFIDIVEVLPAYQRQGIGTALTEKVIHWARMNQVSQVRAWSEEIRREALLLWNKLGFTFSWVEFQRGDEKRYGFYAAKRL